MADGHLGKCKECAKRDVRNNRAARREQYSAYEKERNGRASRKRDKLNYQRIKRQRYPAKAKAWNAVSNAIRDGRLARSPCEKCGELEVQAHHENYEEPLKVRWLCFSCHRSVHGQTVVVRSF